MTDTTQGEANAPNADAEVVKRKVAEHYLVDAAGAKVENEEEATGIGYKLLAVDAPFVYQVPGAVAGSPATMLAIFGSKTLATNETSQARNNAKGAASPQEQLDAVIERFGLIDSGKWIDRTREGVGAKVDKDALAMAISQVIEAAGKPAPDLAAVRAKLEDAAYLRTARQVPEVATAYAALVGRPAKTVDDLVSALG